MKKVLIEIDIPNHMLAEFTADELVKTMLSRFGDMPAYRIIEPSHPVEPSASGEDEIAALLNQVIHADFSGDCAEDLSLAIRARSKFMALQSELTTLRKQNASLQSRLDVMQQDRDDWRDRAMHFAKLTGDAMKALDMMRPFQVKGVD